MLKERQFDNLIDAVREISRREILSGVCGRSGLWMATARPLPVEISRWSGAGPAASARRYLASVRVGRDRAAGGPNGPSGSGAIEPPAGRTGRPVLLWTIASHSPTSGPR